MRLRFVYEIEIDEASFADGKYLDAVAEELTASSSWKPRLVEIQRESVWWSAVDRRSSLAVAK